DRSAARVTDAALTFPVLAPMRLVVVHGMDAWPKGETERLSAYFQNPSPTTCLVLTAGKLDERKSSLLTAVSARGTVISCAPLYERELEGWIAARLRKAGKTASPDAVAFWTASVGSDLHRLASELDKAAAFVGERKEITEEDTAQLMAGGRQVSAFEFVAALGGRDVRAALPLLKKALDGGVPVEILGVILWNFRTLGRVLEWVDQGFSPEAAARKAGIPPFTSKKILPQVRCYRLAEMPDLFASFLEADLAIKGGSPLPPERVLEDLVRRVCGRG
ncbi:MAG: DNA polymerase III subunit delta, partial [Nitrospirae bacterium]|nr:DNA polymerase III subunit delta [Nitrospirota bacterium]